MLDKRIINRLRNLDVEDDAIVLMSYMYDSNDINEEDIFDIGDDEEFNIKNINMYELNDEPTVDTYAYGSNVSYNFEEWYVFNNYDDAITEAEEATRELIDDIGIEGINFSYLGGIERYVDEDWFKDAERESFEGYCYDIADETDYTYDNRLVAECYNEGLIEDTDFETDEEGEPDYSECLLSTDELVERYVDYHMNRIYNFIEEFKFNFGEREFSDIVMERNLIDIDELVSDIVSTDGPANSLARYDGNEVNYDFNGITYYMYRND